MAARIVLNEAGERCIELDLDAVAKHLLCDACDQLLVDAVTLTECAHTFCEACVLSKLEAHEIGQVCPKCRTPVTWDQLKPDFNIRSLMGKLFRPAPVQTAESKQSLHLLRANSPNPALVVSLLGTTTVRRVKRYVGKRLGATGSKVSMRCQGQLLDGNDTVQAVRTRLWRNPSREMDWTFDVE